MKKLLVLWVLFLVAAVVTSTALAGTAVKFSSVRFSLGSLIVEGFASGLGNTDVTVVLNASGFPAISCTNSGGNTVPGRSSPKILALGQLYLDGSDPLRKNGMSPVRIETDDPTSLSWNEAGCPNANWSGTIDFIFWTDATLSVYDTASGALLTSQDYTCTTTRSPAGVSCTRITR